MKRFFLMIVLILAIARSNAQITILELSRADSAEVENLKIAFNQFDKSGNIKEASRQLNSIAYIYWNHNRNDEAIKYYEESLVLNKKLGNENGISMINNNIGILYSDMGQYDKAVKYFENTLNYRRSQKENREALTSSLISLSGALIHIKKYKEAVTYVEEALKYAKDENNLQRMRTCYGTLAEIYENSGEKDKANDCFEKYRGINDLINNENLSNFLKAQKLASQAEFDKMKKQNELLLKEKELNEKTKKLEKSEDQNQELTKNLTYAEQQRKIQEVLADSEKQKRKTNTILFSLGGIILLIVVLFISISLKQKKKAHNKLLAQNEEIQRKSIEIAQQSAEIFRQKEELDVVHADLQEQNNKTQASINYAKLIQNAMMNKTDRLKTFISDSFIFFRPRDIVSGDFYWYAKTQYATVVAAIDCTGHGVPGAFLSMIGNQLFNRLVITQNITNPAQIITEIDEGVQLALNQEHTNNHDGMDIAMCIISNDKKTLRYAGARNPLILIRNGVAETVKANPYSVGGGYSKKLIKKFDEHIFELEGSTSFYIYSDGFQDQTNKDLKKYGSKTFRNLLISMSDKSFEEQKDLLEKEFENHKNGAKQIDDVLVIGARI